MQPPVASICIARFWHAAHVAKNDNKTAFGTSNGETQLASPSGVAPKTTLSWPQVAQPMQKEMVAAAG
jgi:hypothetical protein